MEKELQQATQPANSSKWEHLWATETAFQGALLCRCQKGRAALQHSNGCACAAQHVQWRERLLPGADIIKVRWWCGQQWLWRGIWLQSFKLQPVYVWIHCHGVLKEDTFILPMPIGGIRCGLCMKGCLPNWIGLDDIQTSGYQRALCSLVKLVKWRHFHLDRHFGKVWCNMNEFHCFGAACPKHMKLHQKDAIGAAVAPLLSAPAWSFFMLRTWLNQHKCIRREAKAQDYYVIREGGYDECHYIGRKEGQDGKKFWRINVYAVGKRWCVTVTFPDCFCLTHNNLNLHWRFS